MRSDSRLLHHCMRFLLLTHSRQISGGRPCGLPELRLITARLLKENPRRIDIGDSSQGGVGQDAEPTDQATERQMPKPVELFVPGACARIVLAAVAFAALSSHPAQADDCLAAPNFQAGQSGHWYYRIDRANHRKCWYLGQTGQKVRTAARARMQASRRSTRPPTSDKPPRIA